jgi:hypothetical protein
MSSRLLAAVDSSSSRVAPLLRKGNNIAKEGKVPKERL